MLSILFIATIVVSTIINPCSTVDFSNFGCLQRKNITLYVLNQRERESSLFGYTKLIEEVEKQLGDCSTINVYDIFIQKSVSVKTHYHNLNGVDRCYCDTSDDLDMISHGVKANGDNVMQQILLIVSNQDIRPSFFNGIKMLQQKGWVIITLFSYRYFRYPIMSWFPRNRFFEYGKFIQPRTIISLIDVMKNPLYDRVELAKQIKLDNFEHSCFSHRHLVLHIFEHSVEEILPLLRNAIIAVNQFQDQVINFVFYSPLSRYQYIEYFQFYKLLEQYGVKEDSIVLKKKNILNLTALLALKKDIESTSKKRSIFLFLTSYFGVCKSDESELKDIHFYSPSIYQYPIRQCDGKRSLNIHETIDLHNQEHFMDTINDIVCNKTNGEQKDEL